MKPANASREGSCIGRPLLWAKFLSGDLEACCAIDVFSQAQRTSV